VDHGKPINLTDSIRADILQNGSWYTPYTLSASLATNLADGKLAEQIPGTRSIFEDILRVYSLEQHQFPTDPGVCTDICRKLALSAWTAWLRVVEAHIAQEHYSLSTSAMVSEISTTTWLDKAWKQGWHSRQFGRLVRAKSALESIDVDVYYNMDALGIGGKTAITEDWETDAWKNLEHAVQVLKARLDVTLQAYTQAVSVQESITSNKQARQVGYLTSLATLFIPISFVAAIFSMGGNFSAGAKLFWVYWVIAIPLAMTGCILLFTQTGAKLLGHGDMDGSLV
jgi:hypothetical protein